jgi:hypothetical protein
MDGHVPDAMQDAYLDRATKLRTQLVALKAKDFADGQADVEEANDQLDETNARLADVKAGLDKIADSIAALAKLAAILDTLVSLAAGRV